jgi:hypothetical protein
MAEAPDADDDDDIDTDDAGAAMWLVLDPATRRVVALIDGLANLSAAASADTGAGECYLKRAMQAITTMIEHHVSSPEE